MGYCRHSTYNKFILGFKRRLIMRKYRKTYNGKFIENIHPTSKMFKLGVYNEFGKSYF